MQNETQHITTGLASRLKTTQFKFCLVWHVSLSYNSCALASCAYWATDWGLCSCSSRNTRCRITKI